MVIKSIGIRITHSTWFGFTAAIRRLYVVVSSPKIELQKFDGSSWLVDGTYHHDYNNGQSENNRLHTLRSVNHPLTVISCDTIAQNLREMTQRV